MTINEIRATSHGSMLEMPFSCEDHSDAVFVGGDNLIVFFRVSGACVAEYSSENGLLGYQKAIQQQNWTSH